MLSFATNWQVCQVLSGFHTDSLVIFHIWIFGFHRPAYREVTDLVVTFKHLRTDGCTEQIRYSTGRKRSLQKVLAIDRRILAADSQSVSGQLQQRAVAEVVCLLKNLLLAVAVDRRLEPVHFASVSELSLAPLVAFDVCIATHKHSSLQNFHVSSGAGCLRVNCWHLWTSLPLSFQPLLAMDGKFGLLKRPALCYCMGSKIELLSAVGVFRAAKLRTQLTNLGNSCGFFGCFGTQFLDCGRCLGLSSLNGLIFFAVHSLHFIFFHAVFGFHLAIAFSDNFGSLGTFLSLFSVLLHQGFLGCIA